MSPEVFITVTNALSLPLLQGDKLHPLCCIVSRTVGAILSKRLSGASVRPVQAVAFLKARNQEETQVIWKVLCLKSVHWNACP